MLTHCLLVLLTLNFTLKQAKGGVDIYLYSFFNPGAKWGETSTPRPGRFTPA